jgi:DNA-binding PadR family transcriptional regulator
MNDLDYSAPLTSMSVWVLVALAVEPCHIYGVAGRIYGLSLASLTPATGSIKRTVRSLIKRELIEVVAEEPGMRSGHIRTVYGLTRLGWHQLRLEKRRLGLAAQAIDRAWAHRVVAG